MANLSITAIERGAASLAKRLIERYGLLVEMTVYSSGRGGEHTTSKPSYVELEATGTFTDEDGDTSEAWTQIAFTTGSGGRGRISCQDYRGWREMSAEAEARILHALGAQGWRF